MASETCVVIDALDKLLPADDACKSKPTKDSSRVDVTEVDEFEPVDDVYSLALLPTASNIASSNLASSLRGQTIEVPNLQRDYAGWAQGTNSHYKKMVPLVDSALKSMLSDHAKVQKLQKADIALFAALWWPRAAWDEFQVVTHLSLWLFTWDDEIDMAIGDLSHNFEAAQKFRDETALFIRHALGFGEEDTPPTTRGAIVNHFKVVADALREVYTRDQLQDFLHEMLLFIQMAGREQRYRLTDTIPTPAQYWTCRMGTSAVGICTALNEYSIKYNLPRSIMTSMEMRVILDECNFIVAVVNDILSLKKELSTGCILSAIPVSSTQHLNAQVAVDESLRAHRASIRRIEAASLTLIDRAKDTLVVLEALRSYIDVCKENCTGNYNWSFLTGRYGLKGGMRADGSIAITL